VWEKFKLVAEHSPGNYKPHKYGHLVAQIFEVYVLIVCDILLKIYFFVLDWILPTNLKYISDGNREVLPGKWKASVFCHC
jgi:hypothetical protein